MTEGNSILKSLEPDDEVPEHLKATLISEIDTVRDSMIVVNHFTQNCIYSLTACFSFLEK